MITPTLEKKPDLQSSPLVPERVASLPGFARLVSVVALVNAPLVAFFLLGGKLWSAGSALAGIAISLTACGLLHLFVQKIMPVLVAGMRGQTYRGASSGAFVQFIALVFVKLFVLAVAGYAILNFREVNLPVVLIGFALTQTAIIVTVAKHLKTL